MQSDNSKSGLAYGFPTIFGRGLLDEFKHFVNPPFLVVTMEDLWPIFGHHFEGADCQPYFCGSIEQEDLNREAANLGEVRAIVGLGGGQALDVAKYFAWRRNLPFFQAPTALSVNAVYGQRSGVRVDGKVVYRGWAVPQAIYIDYDVLASCPPALNWSGIGDVLCFHTGVLDWRYAEREGKIEAKWRYDEGLAKQSLAKVRSIVDNVDNIRAMNDRGIEALVDGLKWGTSYHGGWRRYRRSPVSLFHAMPTGLAIRSRVSRSPSNLRRPALTPGSLQNALPPEKKRASSCATIWLRTASSISTPVMSPTMRPSWSPSLSRRRCSDSERKVTAFANVGAM